MRNKACKTCMWWWDLHDTGERKCYRWESPFFHKATEKGCEKHEYPVEKRMNTNVGIAFCKTK